MVSMDLLETLDGSVTDGRWSVRDLELGPFGIIWGFTPLSNDKPEAERVANGAPRSRTIYVRRRGSRMVHPEAERFM